MLELERFQHSRDDQVTVKWADATTPLHGTHPKSVTK